MNETNYISLEQWRALIAVVDSGGYAQAAEALHKSQSAITYAVQKIESLLGVEAFEIQGRRAVLTPTGQLLYRRARALLDEAGDLERAARRLSAGWEAEIGVAVEIIFPNRVLLECLARFGQESPQTRIELIESVLSGTTEALLTGKADLAIAPQVPQGFLGAPLARLRFLAVSHPDHSLQRLGRDVTLSDLRLHRHVAVRDTGANRDRRAVSIEVEQRWTVSNMSTAVDAVCRGHCFAWLPEDRIAEELATGRLRPLPLREGGERFTQLYLIVADPDFAGPGVRRLAELIRETVGAECPGANRERYE